MKVSEDYSVTNNIIFGKEIEMDYVLRNNELMQQTELSMQTYKESAVYKPTEDEMDAF